MRIVVTGATGFVGRNLVSLLIGNGAEVLLVGRNPQAISLLFPNVANCAYEELENAGRNFDLIVHLAVLNNDAAANAASFQSVNVDFTLETLKSARRAGIPRFVHVSSIHALNERNSSHYAQSKRDATRRLAAETGIEITTVFLPYVYGTEWRGRLAFLNKLPPLVARAAFMILAAIKPTVHVSSIADFLLRQAPDSARRELIIVEEQGRNPVFTVSKKLIDISFAVFVLALFWWGLLIIWVLIRLQTPGPGIFVQTRVGRDGRPFKCYKFRTMRQGTRQAGTHEISESEITLIGAFLRKTKIDELPQVFNILRDEMSLVGPRPCLPVQTELINARREMGVLSVKPGITGLAQVDGLDMSEPQSLAQRDARYVALRSLLLDLWIMIRTAKRGGRNGSVVA